MKVILFFATISLVMAATGQKLDSVKLSKDEILQGYSQSDKLLCKSIQAETFFESPEIIFFMGKVIQKDFQSFEKRGDKGSILYFEFENDFVWDSYLKQFLWGNADNPTKQHPEEFVAVGKILIIWSFSNKSLFKKSSKEAILSKISRIK